jgi:hypothetical protein
MQRLYRLATRKRNIRRILAGMFLFVFVVEMASHVLIDSQDPNAVTEAVSCSFDGKIPDSADCPEQRRQQQETKNMMDEMTTHVVIVVSSLTMPHSGIMYRTTTNYADASSVVSRELSPPFHPPQQD